jgi:hypothetical protein
VKIGNWSVLRHILAIVVDLLNLQKFLILDLRETFIVSVLVIDHQTMSLLMFEEFRLPKVENVIILFTAIVSCEKEGLVVSRINCYDTSAQ